MAVDHLNRIVDDTTINSIWQDVETLLRKSKRENLEYVEDFANCYSLESGIFTGNFSISLGTSNKIFATHDFSPLFDDTTDLVKYIETYHKQKFRAELVPLSNPKYFYLKKLQINNMTFNFRF